jgi:hypothetical protein
MKLTTFKAAAREALQRTPHVVETRGARCMAYRDRSGRWREFWNEAPLPGPVLVLQPDGSRHH